MYKNYRKKTKNKNYRNTERQTREIQIIKGQKYKFQKKRNTNNRSEAIQIKFLAGPGLDYINKTKFSFFF